MAAREQAPADQPLLPGDLTLAQFTIIFHRDLLVLRLLSRNVLLWWQTTEAGLRAQGRTVDWDVFRSRFLDKYFSIAARQKKEREFEDLRQGSMSVAEYESQYSALLKCVPHIATNVHAKMRHFLKGLKLELFDRVQSNNPVSFEDAVTRAEMAELVMQEYRAQGRLSEPTRESLRPQEHYFKYQKGSTSSLASFGKRRFDSRRVESRGSISQSVQGQRGESIACPSREREREPRSARGRSLESGGRQPQQFTQRPFGGQPRMQGAGPPKAQVYALTREQVPRIHLYRRGLWLSIMRSSPLSMPLSVATPSGVDILVVSMISDDVTEKKKEVGIEEIPVVAEFADIFPDEIPGFPPIREVEFGIELMPGTSPMSRTPYIMTPAELRVESPVAGLAGQGIHSP
ncbi:uncharacterized protein LOC142520199 [Primulina tabacum]|uniref:uncharacterized protein LOC142520199 n=1 Tax=Primulina tabacum TaxID=48773 RepID=UPI003F598CD0